MNDFTICQLNEIGEKFDQLASQHRKCIGDDDIKFITETYSEAQSNTVRAIDTFASTWNPIKFIRAIKTYANGRTSEFLEGHNILHGQYNKFKADLPNFHSKNFEWESPVDRDAWCYEHNGIHHKKTNVKSEDPDLSHGWLRTHDDIPWSIHHLFQIPIYAVAYPIFTYLFNAQNVGTVDEFREKSLKGGNTGYAVLDKKEDFKFALDRDVRIRREFIKRKFIDTAKNHHGNTIKILLGMAIGELISNADIAMTVQPTHQDSMKYPEGYTPRNKGEWYVMQIQSSQNYAMNGVESIRRYGGLNYQIEHHLFPSIPSWRYHEMSIEVRKICDEYGIVYSADATRAECMKRFVKVVFKYSLPDKLRKLIFREK